MVVPGVQPVGGGGYLSSQINMDQSVANLMGEIGKHIEGQLRAGRSDGEGGGGGGGIVIATTSASSTTLEGTAEKGMVEGFV